MSDEPSTARIWQYSKTAGGLESHLQLKTKAIPTPKPDQCLVRVIATSLNPVDYKIAETPVIGTLAVSKPATPGIDIAGEIVVPASGSTLKRGQLVFGASNGALPAGGGLAEYVLAAKDRVVEIPTGVSPIDAASLPVAAVTAYQAISPNIKPGQRMMWNGGSGGVGVIGIQVAKILGAHITVTCSTRNAELCRSLGADDVVDYTKGDVIAALKAGNKFDLVVDGVGNDHALYRNCDTYMNPGAKYVYIAFSPGLRDISFMFTAAWIPSFLGGQKTKIVFLFADLKVDDMRQVINWMADGKLKASIDSRFPMEKVPDAFRKLKTGRARGKIVIDVAPVSE